MKGQGVLAEDEKLRVLDQWQYRCYICAGDIIDLKDTVYAPVLPDSGDGASIVVPLHAYCYQKHRDKNLSIAREEARIDRRFSSVPAKIFPGNPDLPRIAITREKMLVSFDGEVLRLYLCPNTGQYYFYHQIPREYLWHDGEAGIPELNREKVLRFAAHFKANLQLAPVVCRLAEGRLFLFDGEHRATAQMIGNENQKIDCKVFCDLEAATAVQLVAVSHSPGLRQSGFKPGRLSRRLRRQYGELITRWQEANPDRQCSERALLREAMQLNGDRAESMLLRELVALVQESPAGRYCRRQKDRQHPLSEAVLRLLLYDLVMREPLALPLEAGDNYREEELDNFLFILLDIVDLSLGEGEEPVDRPASGRPEAIWYRDRAQRAWVQVLAAALREILHRRTGEGICYGERFTDDQKAAVSAVLHRLFSHPCWSDRRLAGVLKIRDAGAMERYLHDSGLSVTALVGR